MNKLPRVPKLLYLAAWIILGAGLYLSVSELAKNARYDELASWPHTEAEIIHSEIVGERAVLPRLTYRYSVDGKTFTGKTFLATPPFGARNKRTLTAQTILKEHPVGSTLTIAYDPVQPSQSTTEWHPPWNHYGKIGFSAFLIMLGAFAVLARLVAAKP